MDAGNFEGSFTADFKDLLQHLWLSEERAAFKVNREKIPNQVIYLTFLKTCVVLNGRFCQVCLPNYLV
jgi:hypothetical protein